MPDDIRQFSKAVHDAGPVALYSDGSFAVRNNAPLLVAQLTLNRQDLISLHGAGATSIYAKPLISGPLLSL